MRQMRKANCEVFKGPYIFLFLVVKSAARGNGRRRDALLFFFV